MKHSVDTVVFDLGGVLIRVDYAQALDWLAARGFSPRTGEEFMQTTGLKDHECGRLGGDAFLGRVNDHLATPATPEELHGWWNGFFSPYEDMLALARTLRRTHRVFVLSNVGPLHWKQAMRQFALRSVAENFLTSFEAGVSKPDAAIYEAAERRFGLEPARTVFIDDLPDNAAAARAAGWHAIQHTGFDDTRRELMRLGVTRAD